MSEEVPEPKSIRTHLRRSWKSLFGIQALCLVIGALIGAPLLTVAVQTALASSDKTVLSDTDILSFIASPTGLLLALGLGALWLTLQLLGYAAQLVAGHQSFHGESPTITAALSYTASRLPSLLALSLRFLLQVSTIALPFMAAIAGVAWVQLGQQDINYYLEARPPEFILAVILTFGIVSIMGFVVIRHAVGWMHALPLVLFCKESAGSARQKSPKACRGQKRRIATALALWSFGTPLLLLPTNLIWPPVTMWAAEMLQHRLGVLALCLAIVLLLSSGIAMLIGFTTQSTLALYHLKLFRQTGLDPENFKTEGSSTSRAIPWKLLIAASCVCLGFIAYFCHQRLDRLTSKDDAVVIAHRGASAKAPENTMAAIELAVDSGADWVEIDVQENASGEILVFHDKDFMRMSRDTTSLRDVTQEQIAQLDIGSWFDPRFADQRTPTLREVLEFCKDRAGVIIELKYYGSEEQLEQRTIDIVEATGMTDQVQLMSLKLEGVQKVRKLRPTWRVGLLSSISVGDPTRLDVSFLGLNANSVTDRLIDRAHRSNIEVYAWTVNDPTLMSSLLSRGIDGLITDRPHTCRKVIDERATLNPGERLLIDLAARLGRLPDSPEQ